MKKNFKELNNEELNLIYGGWSGHVGKYDGVINECYYFVYDKDHEVWAYGKLLESFERSVGIFWSRRVHRMYVYEASPKFYSGQGSIMREKELGGDNWTMYKSKN